MNSPHLDIHPTPKPPYNAIPERNVPVNLLLVHNRIRAFLEHSTAYAFIGETRLAHDCSVSVAAISRLMPGYGSPSFAMIAKITQAFEKEFKTRIDPRDVAAVDGEFPTATVCEVVGCKGCTPQAAWNEDDTLKPEYAGKTNSRSRKARS